MWLSLFSNPMRVGIAALLLVVCAAGARAVPTAPVFLGNSVRPVAVAPANGVLNPRLPMISRSTLTATETAAPLPLQFSLHLRNVAELRARMENGERISAAEMAAKYEPLASDYQAVVDWLTSQGMTITRLDPHHLLVSFQAPVGRVAQAMQVNFARVSYRGREFTSATTAPLLPASLTPLLVGVNGLQPHLRPHKHTIRPAASGGSGSYTPAQIAQAYQANGLYSANINGAGQSIAIIIDSIPVESDLVAFWDSYGINQSMSNIHITQVVAGTEPVLPTTDDPDPGSEVTLDTEWSSAMAPGAKVRIYATTTLDYGYLDTAFEDVLTDAQNHPSYGLHQMSMSFGAGEVSDTTGSQRQTDDGIFMELAAAGVTCFASSGDEGPTPDILFGDNTVQAEAPASDPFVVAVGGTTLTSYSSPGPSTEYIWGDGAQNGASGGGASVVLTTTPYLNRPSWQSVVTTGNQRLVPDIASAADPNYGADFYYTEPIETVDSTDYPAGSVSTVIGGTSWASPTCAGFCALINEARANLGQSSIGQLAPSLYALVGTSSFTTNFREITSGSNSTASGNGASGHPNGSYNEATGLGVPLVLSLAETLSNTQSLVGVGQPNQVTVNQGQQAAISVVAGGSPTSYQWQRLPIGSVNPPVDITDNSVYSGTQTGTLTITNTTTGMSGDQFQCVVSYAGNTVMSAQMTALMVENPYIISTLAGDIGTSGLVNNTGTMAEFHYPTGITADASGNVYVADLDNNNIRLVTSAGVVTTAYGSTAGTAGSTNSTTTSARFDAPRDVAFDRTNNLLYVADEGNGLIRRIDLSTGQSTSGQVTTVAGSTTFNEPRGVAVDSAGSVYVADSGNNIIRKITFSNGTATVTTLAGSISSDPGFQDGQGTAARFSQPIGLVVDSAMNVYVADYGNEVVRKITSSGMVSTLAGQHGVAGCLDGVGTQAQFNVPRGITIDGSGNLYVTDSAAPAVVANTPSYSGNELLREISPSGVVTTLAGQAGTAGTANGVGSLGQFFNPCGVTVGTSGALFVADAGNNAVRMVSPSSVTLAATVAYASATSSAQGQFTVSRTGGTGTSLTLNYSTANSTAVAGTDYTTLSGTVTIPAGASSATIAVIPMANPAATSNRTVQVALTSVIAGTAIDPAPATVTLLEAQAETYSTWQTNHPASATPLNDGVANLEKYVFDIDPAVAMTSAERAALPTSGMTTSGTTTYLTLTYREIAGLSGTTTVAPQTSTDLVNWSAAPTPTVIGIDATTQDPIMQVQVPAPVSGGPAFLRLYISP